MKAFKNWIIAHKVLSIIIAAGVTVGAATAIVLPIALKHEHTFATEWSQDGENHWHVCTGKDCDEVKDKAAHVYDNACDTDCNICGATRTVGEHVYDNACDTTCNICGATRTVGEHVYDNACDTTCNICSATRTVGEHVYDNACDTTCNICSATRTVGEHVYDNACDTTCNICSATRTVGEHVYDGEADATCNICGEARALPTRYKANDETEWNAAVNFKEMPRFTLKTTMDGAYGEIVRDGDVIWVTEYEDGESGRIKLGEKFYVKDGETYYIVEWIKDSVYERESCTASKYEDILDIVAVSAVGGLSYADFEYNEETHRYEGATNVHTLTFVGGVIAKIESEASMTTTITFEENALTIPESHVFKIAAERYANALDFRDEDGNYYKNIDVAIKGYRYVVTENAAYYYSGATTPDILETIWTNEDGKGVVYTKKTKDSEWVRTVQTEKFDDFASLVLPTYKDYVTRIPFAQLTYSETDKKYSGSYKYDSSRTVNASMRFEDGKLVEMVRSMVRADGTTMSWGGTTTITYGNAAIEIPTADKVGKTAFALPYDKDNNEYLLENISFSAGETKWFAFEVTKTIYNANKGISGNYDISGSFDGSAVLTIEAENASGCKIENIGTTNGAIYLEELSAAGTYYVKITASEACNGKLSISFA